MMINRYFYRCSGCLEVVALDELLPMEYGGTIAKCANCAQSFEYMGRVRDERLYRDEERCKCDDRCTSARGPKCDCSCGGENHGSGMMGYVMVSTDIGAAPVVAMPTTKSREKALAQYREYKAQVDAALALRDAIAARKNRGEFLPRADFDLLRMISASLTRARKARTHAARIKALSGVMAQPVAA